MRSVLSDEMTAKESKCRWTKRLALLAAGSASAFGLGACSHTPTQTTATSIAAPTSFVIARDDEAINEVLRESLENEISEPKNAEEAVAAAVSEQNLLNRIRAGFALQDADHVNVDREVAWFVRHPDYLDRTFRRAERYLYFIVEELESRKMPLELALLPLVESAFNPVALSRARAAGLWQFIPSTGRRYGLEQSHSYDGRRDIVESTRAALDYLQFLANEFDGDWYQAIAAYNAGEMNVSRAISRNTARGKPTDFFDLDLPRETRAYVPKLLAIRRIVAEPEKYGLEFGHMANQPYFATIDLDSPVDLGVAAQLAGIPKEDLVALNPAYPRAVTSKDGPGHLLVPVDCVDQLRAGLANLTPEQRVPLISYTVRRGDTLSGIAAKLRVSVGELRSTNKLKSNLLRIGQELVVVRGTVPSSTLARAMDPPAVERMVSQDPDYVPPPIPPRAPIDTSGADTHRVRSGETLWSIAKHYRVSINSLADYNSLNKHKPLRVGQKLAIPGRYRGEGTATLAANDARSATVQRITYTVRSGDSLSRIATMFRVEVRELLNWNKLRSANNIRAGQKLVMYVDDSRRNGS